MSAGTAAPAFCRPMREGGEARVAARAVVAIQLFAAKPEHSAGFTYLQLNVQIVHQSPKAAVPQRPSSISAVERGLLADVQ